MQALRQKSNKLKLNITITDIKPGFIDTPMISGRKNAFWVTSADRAAREIYGVIRKKKNHAYIPGRWRLAAWLLKAIPDWLFIRLPV
jgi:short-subunit dehydrogenase